MADENDYQKLVSLIVDVEQTTKKSEVNYVSAAQSSELPSLKQADYEKIIEFIDLMEGGDASKKKGAAPKEKPAPQRPPAGSHAIMAGVAQSQYAVPTAHAMPAPRETPPPSEAVQKHKENIFKELSSIASKFGTQKQPQITMKKKKLRLEDLVLPNLSLADQISELERIIEGLKEHVFDQAHFSIINDEISGLQQVITTDTKARKRDKLNSLEQSLWDLRSQRLNDAITLIGSYGAA